MRRRLASARTVEMRCARSRTREQVENYTVYSFQTIDRTDVSMREWDGKGDANEDEQYRNATTVADKIFTSCIVRQGTFEHRLLNGAGRH